MPASHIPQTSASCQQQPLGWEGLRGAPSPFPKVPQSTLEAQPPREVDPLSNTAWGGDEVSEEEDVPTRYLLFPVSGKPRK